MSDDDELKACCVRLQYALMRDHPAVVDGWLRVFRELDGADRERTRVAEEGEGGGRDDGEGR